MAACDNLVGVKNILLSFTNCDTGQEIKNRSHLLATEEIPKWRIVNYKAEPLAGGYTRRHQAPPAAEIKVIRDLAIPLSWYQGAASISLQVEMENGLVYTAEAGTVTGDDKSDSHEINLPLTYKKINEYMPAGGLAVA